MSKTNQTPTLKTKMSETKHLNSSYSRINVCKLN